MAETIRRRLSGGIFPRRPIWPLLIAIAVILGVGPLTSMMAARKSEPVQPLQHCATMTDDSERLSCFDRATGYRPSPPAKGAFAPLPR